MVLSVHAENSSQRSLRMVLSDLICSLGWFALLVRDLCRNPNKKKRKRRHENMYRFSWRELLHTYALLPWIQWSNRKIKIEKKFPLNSRYFESACPSLMEARRACKVEEWEVRLLQSTLQDLDLHSTVKTR